MLRLNLDRIFKIKGITKTNQYLINLGNSAGYATQLVRGQSNSIQFEKLESLCKSLNCTPNDLFDYSDNSKNPLPEGHALHLISKRDAIEEVNKLLNKLSMNQIEELYGVLKNKGTIND